MGFLRRNLLVPVPASGTLPELNAFLAEGRARVNTAACCRDGRPHGETYRENLAAMRASTVEVLADRGCRVAVFPRAFGEGPAVRNPLSLVPAIIARPRAFGESTIRRGMPSGLVEGIDRMDSADRRRTLRSIGRASESSGFEAALRVVEGGRVPDDATVDVLARRIAGGDGGAGGADPSACDGLLKGAVADGRQRGAGPQGRGGRAVVLAHHRRPGGVVEARRPEAGGVPGGPPRGGEARPRGLEALLALDFVERREDLVLMGDVGTGKTHMASALCALACERRLEARFFTASSPVMRLRRARDDGKLDREAALISRARLPVIDELGFLPLDADGVRLLFQVFADAYERQSVVIATNLGFSRWGSVFGDDQMAAAVIDRIVHHRRLVQFRGESYRVRHALMREG